MTDIQLKFRVTGLGTMSNYVNDRSLGAVFHRNFFRDKYEQKFDWKSTCQNNQQMLIDTMQMQYVVFYIFRVVQDLVGSHDLFAKKC